jgi:predicted  nucleic acid-binding Zn-ribbon protein
MQKELQNKAVQVDNLEKENDQLMSKLAELMRKEKNHEENMKQTRQAMQNEINLLNSRLTNIQVHI